MMVLGVNNEAALQAVYIGTEATPGVAVPPTIRLLGEYTATPGIGAIRRSQDATGGYDRTVHARRQQANPSGTYGEDLTYDTLPQLMRYGLVGGDPGSGDSETPEAHTYVQSPAFNTDDINTFTAQFGIEGLPWQSTGNRWNEFTISADAQDADDVWKFSGTPFMADVDMAPNFEEGEATGGSTSTVVDSGASWTPNEHQGAFVFVNHGTHAGEARMVASNTADTLTVSANFSSTVTSGDLYHIAPLLPSISIPDYEPIVLEGTKVFLDEYNASSSSVGTTEVTDRVLSFNVTVANNLAYKRRMGGIIGKMGRGAREISGTIRFELDRLDEFRAFRDRKELSIRISQEGSVINADESTAHLAQIDIEQAVFDTWSPDTDNNNMTVSLAFVALLPASEPIMTTRTVNTVDALA